MSEENVSLPVAQALASALEKIEAYVPTEYVDNSEPDIDAEHLNHAEQGIMRVTNLLNAAVDVIQGQESRLADAETKIGTAALTGGMTDLSSGLNALNSNLNSMEIGSVTSPQFKCNANSEFDVTVDVVFQKKPKKLFVSISSSSGGLASYGICSVSIVSQNQFKVRLMSFYNESRNDTVIVHYLAFL